MTKTHFPYFNCFTGSGGRKVFRLSLLITLLCCGQMAFASGWGGIKVTRPDGGTESFGKGSGNGAVSGSYEVDSNAGGIGTAKTLSDYTTSACGVDSSVAGSGGCSGSDSASGGCGDANASASITITNNATVACIITYWGDANSNDAITRTQTIKIKQYVDWSTANPGYKSVGDPAYTVTAYGRNIQTGTSGIAPSYSSANTGVCTVNASSGAVTNVAQGTCRVNVSIAGNGNWTAASGYMEWYVRTTQSINVTTAAPGTANIGATFNVAATATSGLAVQITTSGICSVQSGGSGSAVIKISNDSAGTCTVHYNQPGNNAYNPAPQVNNAVTVNKLNQTITFSAQSGQVYSSGGSFLIDPVATSSSNLPVSYASLTAGVCTLSGIGNTTVNIVSAGTCTVRASQSGDATYNAASNVDRSIVIGKASQSITVTSPAPASVEAGSGFTVTAAASSGLGVSITSSGACSGSGTNSATITPAGTGNCNISYVQAGNANYNAAVSVNSVTAVTKLLQTITVTTPAPANRYVGDPFTVVAQSRRASTDQPSGLNVAITVTGGCTRTSGGSNTAAVSLNSGTVPCVIHYNQTGTTTYEPAPERTNTVEAIRINQSITVTTAAPASAAQGVTFPVAASASPSGLPVAITTSGGCSGSGTGSASITMNSATSSCTVNYNQAGDDSYYPAQQILNVVADGTAPVISEITPVAAKTNSTPRYVFNASEAGTLVLGGSCSSATTTAGAGSNTVIFREMAAGTYSDCTLRIADAAGNQSNTLSLSAFEVVPGLKAYVRPVTMGTGDCLSWADACSDIQQAIDIAAVDEVWVAKGIYRPAQTIQLKAGVKIYGGFSGNEGSLSKANPGRNLTIISGDTAGDDTVNSRGIVMQTTDVAGTNLARLMEADTLGVSEDLAVTVSGLIFNAAASTGALNVSGSMLTVEKSQFIANKGANGGAIAVSNAGQLSVGNVTFIANEATTKGGAIVSSGNASNKLNIRSSVFDSNSAASSGGAVSHTSGILSVVNSTFFANQVSAAAGNGGALDLGSLANPGQASIKYSTLVNNAAGGNGRGGAIFIATGATAGITTLANTLVLNNTAQTGSNIADMSKIIDAGYNIVGFGGAAGTVTGASSPYSFTGTSTTAAESVLENIVEPTLLNNGGLTATIAIVPQSIARDRIPAIHTDCGVSSDVKKDQRGRARPDAGSTTCDVGAYEFAGTDTCDDRTSDNGFFVDFYPESGNICGKGFVVSGKIHYMMLLLLSIAGLVRLRYR